ncbi:T9SS type A sorting domain-containing protein [Polaribacter tangerinus]|uniref:T9SS type A sorting domain-containing protein n=1 Tax=Polaribacter tangerinus TaxID=1920034 RepID=UPI0013030C73|nr:T9SS type A sorting domain-containing protein [Polaribacter tangerinus]
MKKITFLILLLSTYIFQAQNVPIDFEDSGKGANWTWVVNDNASNPALEIVANPATTGINTSARVAKFTALDAGNDWALVISDDIGSFTFDASNSLVKLMVRKDVASDVGVKFEGPAGAAKEVKAASSVINGDWEELTFDFKSAIGTTFNKLVIIPDFAARDQDNIIYFDNLTFNAQPAGTVVYNQENIDFEANGFGADFSWTVDQNGANPPLEIVNNPNKTSENNSDKVAKFTALDAGNDWALTYTDDIGSITFDATNSIVKISILKTVASDVGVKFEGPNNSVSPELKVINTIVNGDWEELSFDFSSEISKTYNRIVIIPDFAARSQDNIIYLDNISFNAMDNGSQNGTTNTVTINSDNNWKGFMNVFETNGTYVFGQSWGVADLKTTVSSNTITLQPNFNGYQNSLSGGDGDKAFWTNSSDGGVTPGPKGNKNVEASTFIEPGATFTGKDLTFTGKVVSNTLDANYTAKYFIKALDPNNNFADALNASKVIDIPASGEFSVSVDAADLPAGLIIQYGFTIAGVNANPADESALGSIIIESNTLSTKNVSKLSVTTYPNPTTDYWNIAAHESQIHTISIYNVLGKKVYTSSKSKDNIKIDATSFSKGVYLAVLKSDKGTTSLKLIKE